MHPSTSFSNGNIFHKYMIGKSENSQWYNETESSECDYTSMRKKKTLLRLYIKQGTKRHRRHLLEIK